MSEQPEALRLADMFEAGNCGYPSRAAAELRRLHKVNQELLEALKLALEGLEKWHFDKDPRGADQYITAIREALAEESLGTEQPAQQCNPHPKAPHGFDRNASHSADRYVCECEGWDAYEAGYQAGIEKALEFDADPQPAQQQEPLTPREVELLDGMIEVQLHHASQCDGIANRAMAEKQKVWDMERVKLLRKLKAAHGITGEQK